MALTQICDIELLELIHGTMQHIFLLVEKPHSEIEARS
jgi:hypothetical protein